METPRRRIGLQRHSGASRGFNDGRRGFTAPAQFRKRGLP
jgi:hypothetical protein